VQHVIPAGKYRMLHVSVFGRSRVASMRAS